MKIPPRHTPATPSTHLWTREPAGGGGDHHVVYAPFGRVPDYAAFAAAWKLPARHPVLRHGAKPRPLAEVQPGTVLTLVCHCDAQGRSISDGAAEALPAVQLIARLRQDGLTNGLRKLRFCALSGTPAGTAAFANELQRGLRNVGYAALTVSPFLGAAVAAAPVGHSTQDVFEDASAVRRGGSR
ncbi:hypothetical protein [Muricoccus radiodurans]|uniref:hypothetical protein n=1 Tax=Muricoccus radiodurans TaxID=2231721 RepID=UPI003CF42321